jgi:hypothetical protein
MGRLSCLRTSDCQGVRRGIRPPSYVVLGSAHAPRDIRRKHLLPHGRTLKVGAGVSGVSDHRRRHGAIRLPLSADLADVYL